MWWVEQWKQNVELTEKQNFTPIYQCPCIRTWIISIQWILSAMTDDEATPEPLASARKHPQHP